MTLPRNIAGQLDEPFDDPARTGARAAHMDLRFQQAVDVGLRYKRERDEARDQLVKMTVARDLCKRQTAEVAERWQAAVRERAALLAEFLIWVDGQEGAPTPQRQEAAGWIAREFLKERERNDA